MDKKRIYMIGDSIMQTNSYATYPQTGWGQTLSLFIKDDVEIINLAKNGTSTKSFIDQGRFKFVEDNIKENDLLIIGFAHNDEKVQDPSRFTCYYSTFKENLLYFISVAKRKKANVILTTPVIRRKYVNNMLVDTHGPYVNAIIDTAVLYKIPCINLNRFTYEFFSELDEEKSKEYFMNFAPALYENYPLGNSDDSHLRVEGAVLISKLFVKAIFVLNIKEKMYFDENNLFYCAKDTREK